MRRQGEIVSNPRKERMAGGTNNADGGGGGGQRERESGGAAASSRKAGSDGSTGNGADSEGAAAASDVVKLAPFNPSSDEVQEIALGMFRLSAGDVLFDLGCGDGRFLCSAAGRCPGVRCVGVEVDPVFVGRARLRVEDLPPDASCRVDIRLGDALRQFEPSPPTPADGATLLSPPGDGGDKGDVSGLTLMEDATALYLFVLPRGVVALMPLLDGLVQRRAAEARPFRVVSYMFQIREWEPTSVDRTARGGCPLYYYEFGVAKS